MILHGTTITLPSGAWPAGYKVTVMPLHGNVIVLPISNQPLYTVKVGHWIFNNSGRRFWLKSGTKCSIDMQESMEGKLVLSTIGFGSFNVDKVQKAKYFKYISNLSNFIWNKLNV